MVSWLLRKRRGLSKSLSLELLKKRPAISGVRKSPLKSSLKPFVVRSKEQSSLVKKGEICYSNEDMKNERRRLWDTK